MLTHRLRGLAACLLAFLLAPVVHAQSLTVSTNNTPLDRKALHQISQEAFRRAGLEFKLVSLPSERSLVAANRGEVDGEGLRVAGLSDQYPNCLLYTSPSPRDRTRSRMPSSA